MNSACNARHHGSLWNKSSEIFLWSKTKRRPEIRTFVIFELLSLLVKKLTNRRRIARSGVEGGGGKEMELVLKPTNMSRLFYKIFKSTYK